MRIHLPLLSILASAYLLGMVLLGASVSLYDVSMTVASGPDGLTAELHPTFLCWMDAPLQFHGTCFGNVMVCSSSMWSQTHTRCSLSAPPRTLAGARLVDVARSICVAPRAGGYRLERSLRPARSDVAAAAGVGRPVGVRRALSEPANVAPSVYGHPSPESLSGRKGTTHE